MCQDAPEAPDFKPIADAMEKVGDQMFELGNQQLQFGRQRYQETQPLYQRLVNSNIEGQSLANELARDAVKERLKYRALEDEILQDVTRYSEDQAADRFAGAAAADVQQAAASQRGVANRNLSRMGVNPNSGRFAALNNEFSLRTAAAQAGAKTQARERARAQGLTNKMTAASMGRNLPGTTLSAIGTASNVGGAAGNLVQQQNSPMYKGFQGAMGGLQGQMGGLVNQGNMLNQGYQNELAAYNADGGAMGGIGQIAGMAAGYFMNDGGDVAEKSQQALDAEAQLMGEMNPFERWVYDKTGIPPTSALNKMWKTPLSDKKAAGGVIDSTNRAVDLNADGGGGKILGPGTGTSDSVQAINQTTGQPVRVSNGEYIVKAKTVAELGKEFMDDLNDGKVKVKKSGGRKQAIRKG
jgi:hypothetical protein